MRRRTFFGSLLYLLLGIPMGAIAGAVLLAGWIVTLCLGVTPLVVPALVGFRAVVRGLALVEASLARSLLGSSAGVPRSRRTRGGYWRLAGDVLTDEPFWKQQAFLGLRYLFGLVGAVVEFSLLGAGLFALTEPIYYRWSKTNLGSWHIDRLSRAFLFVPPGIIALVLGLLLVKPLATAWRSIANGLLGGGVMPPPPEPSVSRQLRIKALASVIAVVVAIDLLQIVIWAATSRGTFWPAWSIISLGLPLAVFGWFVVVLERPAQLARLGVGRGLVLHAGTSVILSVYLVLAWSLGSRGAFWPVWAVIGLLGVVAAHVVGEVIRSIRNGRLSERISVLETTRAGAVDLQETELRRIERDLHDGAQARLVALGMSLGLAEQKLATDPEGAREMLADARRGAGEALAELRDLARGIHPPVLADRGLEAAISALVGRTPLHVRVSVDLDQRPPAPVESAAYFVVSEALANTGKHARAEHVDIAVRRRREQLVVEISDDGVGGANRSGSGLTGLAQRVEALDGTLEVTSPTGGPTMVRAVMPCAS